MGLRHREGADIPLLREEGDRVHHRQGGRLQRLRRHHSILVSEVIKLAHFIVTTGFVLDDFND